jgi:hypothetical protein
VKIREFPVLDRRQGTENIYVDSIKASGRTILTRIIGQQNAAENRTSDTGWRQCGNCLSIVFDHQIAKFLIKNGYEMVNSLAGRSQWTPGLTYEPSSPVRKLESWIRIPLRTWTSACAFIPSLCFLVCGYRQCDRLIPVQGVMSRVDKIKKVNAWPRPNKNGLWSHKLLLLLYSLARRY